MNYSNSDVNSIPNTQSTTQPIQIIINVTKDESTSTNEVNIILNMGFTPHWGHIVNNLFQNESVEESICKVTEELKDLTKDYKPVTIKMRSYLKLSLNGPKVHGIEDHLCDQIETFNIQFNGIGGYAEDFVEQSHHE